MLDASGSNDAFSYAAFGLLDASVIAEKNQMEVFVNGVKKILHTDYTVNTVSKLIEFPEGLLEVDDFIRIARNTEKCDLYVDFVDNTVLTEKDLDLSANQIFFVAQEAFDLAYQSLRINDGGTMWDGRGYEANNFLPAMHSSSLVTLGQVQNLLNGVDSATIAATPMSPVTLTTVAKMSARRRPRLLPPRRIVRVPERGNQNAGSQAILFGSKAATPTWTLGWLGRLP